MAPVWPFPIYVDFNRANNTAPTVRSAGQSLIRGCVLTGEYSYSIRGIACRRGDSYFSKHIQQWQSASPLELTNRRNMMRKDSLRQLYIDELKDLYSAETQMVKALPKMAKASSNAELRQGFEEHLRQTSEHVSRLEQIFEMLGEKPTGKKCLGM